MSRSAETRSGYLVRLRPDAGSCLVLHGPGLPGTVEALRGHVEEAVEALEARPDLGYIDFQVAVADLLEQAHARALEVGETAKAPGAAVSFSLLMVREAGYWLAHLGACRPLVYGREIVHPLVREHTEAFALYEQGQLRAQDIQRHPGVRRLTRGIGLVGEDSMDATLAAFRKGSFADGERLLFPAGDLLAHLGEEGLLEILDRDQEPARVVEELTTSYQEGHALGLVLILFCAGAGIQSAASSGLLGTWSPTLAESLAMSAEEAEEAARAAEEEAARKDEATGDDPASKTAEPEALPVYDPLLDPDLFPEGGHVAPPPFPVGVLSLDPVPEDGEGKRESRPPKITRLDPSPEEADAAPSSPVVLPEPLPEPEPEPQPVPEPEPAPAPAATGDTSPAAAPPAPSPGTGRSRPPPRSPRVSGIRDRRRSSRRLRRRRRMEERWVDLVPESRLEEPVVIGSLLLGASLVVLGLLWMYLFRS